jgi:pyruvate kinase
VQPVKCDQALSIDHMVDMAEEELLSRSLLKSGDVLGVVAGTRQASGSTNFMRLHTVTMEETDAVPPSKRKRAAARQKL